MKYNHTALMMFIALSLLLGGCTSTAGWQLVAGDLLAKNVGNLFSGESDEYHKGILSVEDDLDITGFRGLAWGDNPTPDMELVRTAEDTNGSVKVYQKSGEKMSIGKADLARVEYYFLENRFIKANVITVNNKTDGEELEDVVIAKYGMAMAPDGMDSNPLDSTYKIAGKGTNLSKLSAAKHWRAENGYIAMRCLPNKIKYLKQSQCEFSWGSWGGVHGYLALREEALKDAGKNI